MLAIMAGRWKVVTATGQTAQYVNSSNQVIGIAPDQLAALNAGATIWQPLKSAGAFYSGLDSFCVGGGAFCSAVGVPSLGVETFCSYGGDFCPGARAFYCVAGAFCPGF